MRWLCTLLTAILLASCASPEKASTGGREVAEKSGNVKPMWLERGTFADPERPGNRCFTGLSTGEKDRGAAVESAWAAARRRAAEFTGTRVQGVFEQVIKQRFENESEQYDEMVRSQTRTMVDGYIQRSEQAARPYWILYADGTYEAHALLSVPEEELDPVPALVRALRREAVKSGTPDQQIRYMDSVLALNLHDLHAQYVKARALENAGRTTEAYAAMEELRDWNGEARMDLHRLYGNAELPVPKGSPQYVDLDEQLFRMKPHWDDFLSGITTLAVNHANTGRFTLRVNRQTFHRSEYREGARPLQLTMQCPDGETRWIAWFWMDAGGICQVNSGAPGPDPKKLAAPRSWALSLECPPGEVMLLAIASGNRGAVDFTEIDAAFSDKAISKKKVIEDKDRDEVVRLESLFRVIEERARKLDSFLMATVRFTVKP